MKLNAIDTEELKIIATVLQDGLIEVNDVKYLPSIRTFIVMITRFMWEEKIVNKTNNRTKAVLVFEDVLAVHSKNMANPASVSRLEHQEGGGGNLPHDVFCVDVDIRV